MLQKLWKATAGTRLESQEMYLQTHIVCEYMHTCMQLVQGLVNNGSSCCAGTAGLLSPEAEIHREILLLLHCFLKQS